MVKLYRMAKAAVDAPRRRNHADIRHRLH
jgi:hypothetical protein